MAHATDRPPWEAIVRKLALVTGAVLGAAVVLRKQRERERSDAVWEEPRLS